MGGALPAARRQRPKKCHAGPVHRQGRRQGAAGRLVSTNMRETGGGQAGTSLGALSRQGEGIKFEVIQLRSVRSVRVRIHSAHRGNVPPAWSSPQHSK